LLAASPATHAQLARVSLTADGSQANADSYQAAISDDGSVVAFRSNASNLVAGDTNQWSDIFVRDLAGAMTVIASRQPGGSESVSFSQRPSLSGDGRYVVFETPYENATILSAGLYDRVLDTNSYLLFLENSAGNPTYPRQARLEPVLSGDGAILALRSRGEFQSVSPPAAAPPDDDNNLAHDVFIHEWSASPVEPLRRVSRLTSGDELDADSRRPALSHDGSRLAFMTYSDLLGSDSNSRPDVVVKDTASEVLELMSITPAGFAGNGGSFNPAVSADAMVVAFRSEASDLIAGDDNGRWDIFVRDRAAATTTRISVASDGTQADHHSSEASISDDGRFVAFRSLATNLVPGDTNGRADIFVHDRATGQTVRVSQPAVGESDGNSAAPAISGNGAWIVFESDATNLVAGDTNAARDIFRAANPMAAGNRGGR
jgi:Tol biopolymer transport system component